MSKTFELKPANDASKGKLSSPRTTTVRLCPRRIAVVARDWTSHVPGGYFLHHEITPHVGRVVRFCANEGCDTVLFALWTHCARLAGNLAVGELLPRGVGPVSVVAG